MEVDCREFDLELRLGKFFGVIENVQNKWKYPFKLLQMANVVLMAFSIGSVTAYLKENASNVIEVAES